MYQVDMKKKSISNIKNGTDKCTWVVLLVEK